MPTYIALRHTDPGGWHGLFARFIRARLVTAYPHAGVCVGATLYHSTLARGVHAVPMPTTGWLLLPTTTPAVVAQARAVARLGTPYDWLSLLAFVLPLRVRYSRADYCYEFVWQVLTGQKPTGPVTAEQLAVLAAQQLAETTTTESPA